MIIPSGTGNFPASGARRYFQFSPLVYINYSTQGAKILPDGENLQEISVLFSSEQGAGRPNAGRKRKFH